MVDIAATTMELLLHLQDYTEEIVPIMQPHPVTMVQLHLRIAEKIVVAVVEEIDQDEVADTAVAAVLAKDEGQTATTDLLPIGTIRTIR